MRAFATIAAIGLLGTALTGCDMPGSGQQQAAAPCNCTGTPPATIVAAPSPTEHLTRLSYGTRHHYVRHRYYADVGYRNTTRRTPHYRGGYNTDYSQQSVDAYDYVSSSRRSESRYSSSYSSSSTSYGAYGEGSYGGRITWVDGYGRGYYNSGPVTVAATMRGPRLDPYHGYLVDCPDDGQPH
ncbi:MAG TPA: hypothetical protein VIJ85_01285 [Rhizomicrobium sp.]